MDCNNNCQECRYLDEELFGKEKCNCGKYYRLCWKKKIAVCICGK